MKRPIIKVIGLLIITVEGIEILKLINVNVPEVACTWYETGPVICVTVIGIHLSGPLTFLEYKESANANF